MQKYIVLLILFLVFSACRSQEERYIVGTWQWSIGRDTLNLYFNIDHTYESDAGAELGTWVDNSDFDKLNLIATERTVVCSYNLTEEEREGWLKWTQVLNVYTYEYECFEGSGAAGDRVYTRIYTSLWGIE